MQLSVSRTFVATAMFSVLIGLTACSGSKSASPAIPSAQGSSTANTSPAGAPAKIYVPDSGNDTVTEYDQHGNQIATSGTFPGLHQPISIAFDPDNSHLYVVSTRTGFDRVTVYDLNGNQVTTSGTFQGLHQPFGIIYDPVNDGCTSRTTAATRSWFTIKTGTWLGFITSPV